MDTDEKLATVHLSVDCTVLGFDGSRLEVLLIRRTGVEGGQEFHDMKLPGSLIVDGEELDDAARRVLTELTGLKNIPLVQFHAFGSLDRTKDPKDIHWLERAHRMHVHRAVTIAYMALVKIGRNLIGEMEGTEALWVPVNALPPLAFDHNRIIGEAVKMLRTMASMDPSLLYALLPRKFTVTQLRNLYEVVFGVRLDPANFYKKMVQMPYIVPLDEREKGVAHRAARYYRFDKNNYNKTRI
ncbi:MAG: NUDIX domain-containing protein [Bacteroidales bacterium]|nr:NUDIX domain-containing protein [Bacteroidales bacterium]